MAITLELSGNVAPNGAGTFIFNGNSTTNGDISGSGSGFQNISGAGSEIVINLVGNASITGPISGTVTMLAQANGQFVLTINIP